MFYDRDDRDRRRPRPGDRDGDGIPDIFDRRPDIPARNHSERRAQDRRYNYIIPIRKRKTTLISSSGTTYKPSTEKIGELGEVEGVERIEELEGGPFVTYVLAILYLLGFATYGYFYLLNFGLVCWLVIGAAVAIAFENITANMIRGSFMIPGLIGLGLSAAALWLLGFNYLLLGIPVFVIFIGYLLQSLFATDECGTGAGAAMFLFHTCLVTGIEYYVFNIMLGIDLFANLLLLGGLIAGNVFNGIEGGVTMSSNGSTVFLGLIGIGIYAGLYFFLSLPMIVFMTIVVLLVGIIIEDIAMISS